MAAAAIGMYRQGVNIFTTGIGSLLILNLVLTFAIPGIAIGGHVGGAIGGAICGFVMLAPRVEAVPAWTTYAYVAAGRRRLRRQRRRRHLTLLIVGHLTAAAQRRAVAPWPGARSLLHIAYGASTIDASVVSTVS